MATFSYGGLPIHVMAYGNRTKFTHGVDLETFNCKYL